MPAIKAKSSIEWYYDIDGEGEPLLFIHGWGVDRRIWRQQTKYFAQKYRVMAIDMPGHGNSEWKDVPLEEMAHDLAHILDSVDFKNITIIGSSLGGLLALKYSGYYSKNIKRLVFVGSMPKFSKSEDYPYGLNVELMRKLGGQLEASYPSIVNIFFRSLFTREERETRRFKWLQKFRQTDKVPIKQALVEYLDILENEDLRDTLKRLDEPIQFINGTDDEICNRETVTFLQQIRPNSKFDFFEKCGHFPFLSKPHEFNELLEKFLESN